MPCLLYNPSRVCMFWRWVLEWEPVEMICVHGKTNQSRKYRHKSLRSDCAYVDLCHVTLYLLHTICPRSNIRFHIPRAQRPACTDTLHLNVSAPNHEYSIPTCTRMSSDLGIGITEGCSSSSSELVTGTEDLYLDSATM